MEDDFLKVTKEMESENGFKKIAEKLFNSYAIKNHESIYRLTEIEFYWTSNSHVDNSTYKRKYVNPKQGDWFFHYSGVDIALRNDEIEGHGGILIRGICDVNSKEKTISNRCFKGPMVCAMKLFSGTSAFNKSIETRIVKYDFPNEELKKTKRIGLGKNATDSGTENLKYRFIIDIS